MSEHLCTHPTALPSASQRRALEWVGLALAVAWLSACSQPAQQRDGVSAGSVAQAWVQRSANHGWVVRAITSHASCPLASWEGNTTPMRTRADSAAMAMRSCELDLPPDARNVRVGDVALPAPPQDIQRIVLIGDTGCRMKASEDYFQDCNDSAQWPFAQIAQLAASKRPDLVIHVGDMHYRESPCPPGRSGCANSPWGYGYDTWKADFFQPAQPLLREAPWLMVRGNHESCARAGLGWQRFLDPQPWSFGRSCESATPGSEGDFTPPYAVPLSADTQLIVFDSSFVLGRAYSQEDPVFKRYAAQMEQVRLLSLARPHNFFLSHHPVLAFAGGRKGQLYPGNAGLQSVLSVLQPGRLFAPSIDVVMGGHYHLFEGLDFVSDHPLSLVMGNAGSSLDSPLDKAAAMAAQPAPGAKVRSLVTQQGFGFATLDRNATGWLLTEWSAAGTALLRCQMAGTQLSCQP